MARFDVIRLRGDGGLVLDCQADLLSQLSTRLVVPLVPRDRAPPPMSRLNPVFVIDGQEMVMMTQFAAAVEVRELGAVAVSLAAEDVRITNALDVLITGI